jgi:glycine/D-amino acid oxidase-like deaminating enzyme
MTPPSLGHGISLMSLSHASILILGAGLQGAGVALELARRGIAVTLLEQDPVPINRASLRNEGKIHLGLIYANDRSLETAFLQLQGGLRFRSIVDGWLGAARDWLVLSTPFHYMVADDSVLTPDELTAHYDKIQDRCRAELERCPELDYLGARPESLYRRLTSDEIAAHFDAKRFAVGFATRELAIDPVPLALALRAAIARSEEITFLPSRTVRAITQRGDRYRVEGDGPEGAWSLEADQVVNATWERRLALDRQVGLAPPKDLLHRLKYRVIARLPDELNGAPSVTMVLGRYGDVVVRPDGTAYLSWYPVGLRGWTHDIEPPRAWDEPCRGEVPSDEARDIAARLLAGIDAWYPGIGRATPLQIDAGAIVAFGRSDVDDAASGLHDRSRIGVTSCGGYHSVEPGKLTTAPRIAVDAADRVEAFRQERSPSS